MQNWFSSETNETSPYTPIYTRNKSSCHLLYSQLRNQLFHFIHSIAMSIDINPELFTRYHQLLQNSSVFTNGLSDILLCTKEQINIRTLMSRNYNWNSITNLIFTVTFPKFFKCCISLHQPACVVRTYLFSYSCHSQVWTLDRSHWNTIWLYCGLCRQYRLRLCLRVTRWRSRLGSSCAGGWRRRCGGRGGTDTGGTGHSARFLTQHRKNKEYISMD